MATIEDGVDNTVSWPCTEHARTCPLFSPMRFSLRLLACVLSIAVACRLDAQPTDDPRYRRALGVLYTTSQLGGLVKEWCDARAPETRGTTDSALATWRVTHRLTDIDARSQAAIGDQLPALRAAVADRRNDVFRRLDGDSRAPVADCRQRLHPAEWQLVQRTPMTSMASTDSAAPPQTTALPPMSSAQTERATPKATVPVGRTVYTVAQLVAIAGNNERTGDERLTRLGLITVQGTLRPTSEDRDASVWLYTLRDGKRSTRSVKCYDLSLRRVYDRGARDVVLEGRLRAYDSYWIELEDCRVVTDSRGLVAATNSDAGAMQRDIVRASQVCHTPNSGVMLSQIEGILQPADLRFDAMKMLYLPDETTLLVLKDGWLYDNLDCSPHDLDVATSRRLEPQRWHRWRRQGATLAYEDVDDDGHSLGTWTSKKMIARPPLAGRRLTGTFSATNSVTVGIASSGATSISSTTYSFQPDGRFRWSNFSQLFASSSTGPSTGSVAVGGTVSGPTGTYSSAVGGGDDTGTYTIEGFTLILRTTSGRVLRLLAFSWDTDRYRDYLVLGGTTYAPSK
jgi:hypothetical protein